MVLVFAILCPVLALASLGLGLVLEVVVGKLPGEDLGISLIGVLGEFLPDVGLDEHLCVVLVLAILRPVLALTTLGLGLVLAVRLGKAEPVLVLLLVEVLGELLGKGPVEHPGVVLGGLPSGGLGVHLGVVLGELLCEGLGEPPGVEVLGELLGKGLGALLASGVLGELLGVTARSLVIFLARVLFWKLE